MPLPRWAYVPGETTDAEADHDTLWRAKALVPSRFRDFIPARHPALRYGIALNDAGYFWESHQVLEAVNGYEAIALAEGHEQIDLLLTDVIMPGITGPDVAARLRNHRPELAVLYMSGYDNELIGVGNGAQ